ncbi:hypothetical protein [Thermococcus radiotolerans]|uniref:Uncharacterized protein n=1 Tax=Thermococcus radiotolerans TaxID=187880 RepID=A0A2Z2N1I8_9EURY|nr:hypothetical protein [Thermococcus radiotolerans]ASJ14837.1 hypothetical protein A3L10_06680 [Thermococcus radiotolerans]
MDKNVKIAILVFSIAVVLTLGYYISGSQLPSQDSSEGIDYSTITCTLETEPQFTPANAWTGWSVRELVDNRMVEFTDFLEFVPRVSLSEGTSSGFLHAEDWPTEMGIAPKCTLAGSAVFFENKDTGRGMYYPVVAGNRGAIKRQDIELPAGDVYFAHYVIPVKNATWEVTENLANSNGTDFLRSGGISERRRTQLTGACTCPVEAVIAQLDEAIKAKGFEEVTLEKKPAENEYFRPLSAKLYRRGDDYLYVEFAKVKDMDLVRVLMIMGDEEVVKAYAEAFTAGSVEG